MKTPEDVQAIKALYTRGWGFKRIAKELLISKNTVKRYIKLGNWKPYATQNRTSVLDGLDGWLQNKFIQHRGNAAVIHQELCSEHNIKVSLRTVERAVAKFRGALYAEAKATIRYETEPGEQLQIDFGSTKVRINGEKVRVFLFVATLGFSRRIYVQAFTHERQSSWLKGLEGSFRHFEGIPHQVLIDNPKPLVQSHKIQTREVIFNERFLAFANYWGFTPKACAPYRARTKGKDERSVGYVKHNAIAGREFNSWDEFEAHLTSWNENVADQRIHGTTGEKPIERFRRVEADRMKSAGQRPSFLYARFLKRIVHSDACVEVDTNRYSVPWKLIGKEVEIEIIDGLLTIYHNGQNIASHKTVVGHRHHSIDYQHLKGVVGAYVFKERKSLAQSYKPKSSALLRPLSEYAAAMEGVR